jgi:hypothetical protein
MRTGARPKTHPPRAVQYGFIHYRCVHYVHLGPACRSCGAVRGEERPKRESLEYHFRDLHAIDRIPLCCPVAVDIRTCASSIQTMSALLANG